MLQQHQTPPQQWKQATVTVIHKSGDPKLPSNYRPISIIPLLYKLFSKILYNRLEPILDAHQTPDQAGSRHDYSTEGHLYTMTLLHEKSYEWQLDLWIATIDFKKAFDTVDHNQLWQALSHQNVPEPYINLLKSLYSNQVATVKTDRVSKNFNIERGVKQGDPLSSLLFNAALEDLFKQIKHKWRSKAFGIQLGHTTDSRLTNLRFADDVVLLAPNLQQPTTMLQDLDGNARDYGLELHPGKTNILTNVSRGRGRTPKSTININNMAIKIL